MTWIQLKLYSREPIAFFFTLIFPVLLLAMYGIIWGNAPGSGYYQDYGYIDMQLPALTAVIIGTVGLMSVPVSVATNREQKILRRFRRRSMRPLTYIAADVAVNYLVALVGMAPLSLLARWCLICALRQLARIFVGFTLATLAFIAIGYIVASLHRRHEFPGCRPAHLFPRCFSPVPLPLFLMPEGATGCAMAAADTIGGIVARIVAGRRLEHDGGRCFAGDADRGTLVSARLFRWE